MIETLIPQETLESPEAIETANVESLGTLTAVLSIVTKAGMNPTKVLEKILK